MGLRWLSSIRESEASTAFVRNPHELERTLECLTHITVGEIIMHASLARKASNSALEFKRLDYPKMDPPEWNKLVTISRAQGSATFPANFMLVGAMNPCPCGYYSDPNNECSCTIPQIHRYRSKISGPLMDRIDIHIEVPAVKYQDLASRESGESYRLPKMALNLLETLFVALAITFLRGSDRDNFRRF
jgi:hypothetical protein